MAFTMDPRTGIIPVAELEASRDAAAFAQRFHEREISLANNNLAALQTLLETGAAIFEARAEEMRNAGRPAKVVALWLETATSHLTHEVKKVTNCISPNEVPATSPATAGIHFSKAYADDLLPGLPKATFRSPKRHAALLADAQAAFEAAPKTSMSESQVQEWMTAATAHFNERVKQLSRFAR